MVHPGNAGLSRKSLETNGPTYFPHDRINAQMLAALKFALPVLRDGLPGSVNFDWMKEAVAKAQDAIAEAERDP